MTVAASFVMPPRDAFGNIAATPNPFTAAVQTEVGGQYTVAAPSGSGTVKVLAPSGTVIGSGTSVSFTATTASVVLVVESPAAGYITVSLIPPASEELPVPSASGDVLTATGTDAGDYDWATPAGTVPTPPASGDVLTSTGSGAGDYDWATPQTGSTIPDPPASGDVLTSTGTGAGDWDWAAPATVSTALSVSTTIDVKTGPTGVAVGPDGSAYVTNFGSNTVSVIDTSTNAVTATVTVGTNPYDVAITPNGDYAYVANFSSNTVSVIDTSTNAVTATVDVGTEPYGVAITPNGDYAYVSNYGSNTVSVIVRVLLL